MGRRTLKGADLATATHKSSYNDACIIRASHGQTAWRSVRSEVTRRVFYRRGSARGAGWRGQKGGVTAGHPLYFACFS